MIDISAQDQSVVPVTWVILKAIRYADESSYHFEECNNILYIYGMGQKNKPWTIFYYNYEF